MRINKKNKNNKHVNCGQKKIQKGDKNSKFNVKLHYYQTIASICNMHAHSGQLQVGCCYTGSCPVK